MGDRFREPNASGLDPAAGNGPENHFTDKSGKLL
jgi:hypothetical protein